MEISVNLVDYEPEEGNFKGILIHWEKVSETENNIGAATFIYSIFMADCSMTLQESNDYYLDIVDKASDNSSYGMAAYRTTQNSIEYSFSYLASGDYSMLSISAPIDI